MPDFKEHTADRTLFSEDGKMIKSGEKYFTSEEHGRTFRYTEAQVEELKPSDESTDE